MYHMFLCPQSKHLDEHVESRGPWLHVQWPVTKAVNWKLKYNNSRFVLTAIIVWIVCCFCQWPVYRFLTLFLHLFSGCDWEALDLSEETWKFGVMGLLLGCDFHSRLWSSFPITIVTVLKFYFGMHFCILLWWLLVLCNNDVLCGPFSCSK